VQVGLQIARHVYATVGSFEVFVRFLGYILESNPKCKEYKEFFEEKAYRMALQAIKI
jgi:hypothetical protein